MEKQEVRLNKHYPRIMGVFGAWIGIGVAILQFATEQWIFGALLTLGTATCIVIAIKGTRASEKVYTKAEILIQWITITFPVGCVVLMLLLLYRYIFPIAGYFIGYAVVLVVIAALAGRELRGGVPIN